MVSHETGRKSHLSDDRMEVVGTKIIPYSIRVLKTAGGRRKGEPGQMERVGDNECQTNAGR